ncbi:MAG TPA: DUF1232 domain-containing protein [Acidimicrobiia bacterium]
MKYAVGIVVALATMWLILVLTLIAARPKGLRVADAARLMPDLLLLVRDLARDPSIPRRVRARIWILMAWIASPIDAIPDIVPVIGMADDVILVYLVLRSVARVAGNDALERHWRGTPEALAVLEHLLGLDHNPRARVHRRGQRSNS